MSGKATIDSPSADKFKTLDEATIAAGRRLLDSLTADTPKSSADKA
jgi:hypothetical protein